LQSGKGFQSPCILFFPLKYIIKKNINQKNKKKKKYKKIKNFFTTPPPPPPIDNNIKCQNASSSFKS